MLLIHPDATLIPLLNRILAGDLTYHLCQNDVTPSYSTVLADFQEKDPAGGYAPVTVTAASFIFEGVSSHHATKMATPISWIPGANTGHQVFAYYVTDPATGFLLAAARLDGAPVAYDLGASIIVTPVLGDQSQYS